MKKIFLILSFFLMIPIIAALIIVFVGMREKKGKADIGVVLGTTIYEDGSLSPYLKARLDEAAQLYKKQFFPILIVSGGHNAHGLSEAEVMQNYLVSLGVPAAAIRQDPLGVNTAATAKNTKAIMEVEGAKSVFIITQFFHVPRTRLAFSCQGINEVYYAPSKRWNLGDMYSLLREVPANIVYLWKCNKS